jgi:hypothetical protein
LHPDRTLHAKPTFSVELIYGRGATDGFDFSSARARVRQCLDRGVKVALRADYAHQQALPPQHNEDRVHEYVEWCQSLAADPVFGKCEWLICGNEPNLSDENRQTGGEPMDAWWPARVVFGHRRPTSETDNVYQFVRTVNDQIQVLLPAVAPYSDRKGGAAEMPEQFPPGSGNRTAWAPWETYQFELFLAAYDNDFHADIGEVKSAMHTYGDVGADGTSNGGRDEPHRDVRESSFKAQFGTRWLGDALYLFRQAQRRVYGSVWDPWVLVTECNTLRGDDSVPRNNYPAGWWIEVARYIDSLPNVMGLAAFADQDLGGFWARTCMTAPEGRLGQWDADHDRLLRDGW